MRLLTVAVLGCLAGFGVWAQSTALAETITVDCRPGRVCLANTPSDADWLGLPPAAVGALIAAVAAAMFAIVNEWNKNRLRRKGVARVLANHFHRSQSMLARALVRETWWHDEDYIEPEIESDDLKRLASACTPSEWAAVASADGWLKFLDAHRKRLVGESGKREPRVGDERTWLEATYERLETGRFVLRRLGAALPMKAPYSVIDRAVLRDARETEPGGLWHVLSGLHGRFRVAGRPHSHQGVAVDQGAGEVTGLKTLTFEQLRRRARYGVTAARNYELRDRQGSCQHPPMAHTHAPPAGPDEPKR